MPWPAALSDDTRGRYLAALAGVVAIGLAARVGWVLGPAKDVPLAGDSGNFYRPVARSLAGLHGFTLETDGVRSPAGRLPPLFPVVLALFDLVGLGSVRAQQLGMAVLNAIALVPVAEVGRRLRGPAVGIVAGVFAALSPLWITHTSALMTEGMVLVLVPSVLLAALWTLEAPSGRRYALVGLLLGLTALNRSDAALLALLVVGALALAAPGGDGLRRRLAGPLVALLVVGLVVAPWVVRNQIRLDSATISLNSGNTMAGANCPDTYGDPPYRGSWRIQCAFVAGYFVGHSPEDPLPTAELERRSVDFAIDYARDNTDRLPAVVSARVMRTWGVYPIEHQLELARQEGRSARLERIGLRVWQVSILPFLIGAVVAVRSRDRRFLLLLAPMVHVTVVSALIYGSTRMGTAAQPAIAVLVAIGVCAVVDRVRGWLRPA